MTTEWFDPPPYEESYDLYREMGLIRARLVALKHDIENADAALKRDYPRKPHERRLALPEMYAIMKELQAREAELEFEIKFMSIRFDMFRALSYKKG